MTIPSFNIEWDAAEYEHKERSPEWFWSVGILTFALAIVVSIFGNVIFGIFIILAAFSLSLFINREPDHQHVVIHEKGVTKEDTLYPYSTLESFWIDEEHPHKKIILRSKKLFMPLIIVPLGDEVDAERVRRTLLRFISEEYHELPLMERFLEFLGF